MSSVEFDPRCIDCPLVIACAETSHVYQGHAADVGRDIVQTQEPLDDRFADVIDELDIALAERVHELTYDSTAALDSEEAKKLHDERRARAKVNREFDDIVLNQRLAEGTAARVEALKNLQIALGNVAAASDEYARDLHANCKKGPGKIREYGIVGKKLPYCRSGGISPNLQHFTASDKFRELTAEVALAHKAVSASYRI